MLNKFACNFRETLNVTFRLPVLDLEIATLKPT
jgi:hypothetical protein